jgi:hypothetical protein
MKERPSIIGISDSLRIVFIVIVLMAIGYAAARI